MAAIRPRGAEESGKQPAKPAVKATTTARKPGQPGSSNRGFASMDPERQVRASSVHKHPAPAGAPAEPGPVDGAGSKGEGRRR